MDFMGGGDFSAFQLYDFLTSNIRHVSPQYVKSDFYQMHLTKFYEFTLESQKSHVSVRKYIEEKTGIL